MSIGNLQYILLHDIHNLFCGLILKHESTSPEFVWGFQCSLLGSKIHYLGQEKSNSLHGSTQVVNIHYLGQIHNLGQNRSASLVFSLLFTNELLLYPRSHRIYSSCPDLPLKMEAVVPQVSRKAEHALWFYFTFIFINLQIWRIDGT